MVEGNGYAECSCFSKGEVVGRSSYPGGDFGECGGHLWVAGELGCGVCGELFEVDAACQKSCGARLLGRITRSTRYKQSMNIIAFITMRYEIVILSAL